MEALENLYIRKWPELNLIKWMLKPIEIYRKKFKTKFTTQTKFQNVKNVNTYNNNNNYKN